MDTIQLAFYKGKGTIIDKIIRWGTASPYSHVEFIHPDEDGLSASPREGVVRKKDINFHSGNWDIVEINWANLKDMTRLIENEMGAKYDYFGVFMNHIISISRPGKAKWFCSELMAHGLGFETPHVFSPGTLYNMVKYLNELQEED